ncbi:hypothetical protein P280DRAFT_86935 [Massarina eburnea CBS 473.64]|uniref:Uncharacterized protein n=1 Tax=Massarina eburnea CBS 473.64 TaxID=1395130 RepID=A0A6A6RQT2_9PLEO|nr:hypothetical protein P280DRAFT_86935 [Massarina eburnea CBS 473.64]
MVDYSSGSRPRYMATVDDQQPRPERCTTQRRDTRHRGVTSQRKRTKAAHSGIGVTGAFDNVLPIVFSPPSYCFIVAPNIGDGIFTNYPAPHSLLFWSFSSRRRHLRRHLSRFFARRRDTTCAGRLLPWCGFFSPPISSVSFCAGMVASTARKLFCKRYLARLVFLPCSPAFLICVFSHFLLLLLLQACSMADTPFLQFCSAHGWRVDHYTRLLSSYQYINRFWMCFCWRRASRFELLDYWNRAKMDGWEWLGKRKTEAIASGLIFSTSLSQSRSLWFPQLSPFCFHCLQHYPHTTAYLLAIFLCFFLHRLFGCLL